VRVRALRPLRRAHRVQRRRRRGGCPREQRRVCAREERDARVHPHGQRPDRQALEGAAARHAGRDRELTGSASPRLRITVACLLISAVAAACSSGSGSGNSDANALPPNDKAAIERVFAPALDRLGVRLTRGALVDPKTGKPSSSGKHLAVYVEPTGNYTSEDYARGTVATL